MGTTRTGSKGWGESGQMLTEYAVVASILLGACLVAAGPLGLLDAFARYFDSFYFVVSLPLP